MKQKKIAKIIMIVALAISILTNSVGNIFAQKEQQVEETISEEYEKEATIVEEEIEEIKKIDEIEEIKEIDKSIGLEEGNEEDPLPIETQEQITNDDEQTASYVLSKEKFQKIYLSKDEYINDPYVRRVIFTDDPLPTGGTEVDLSENGDGSVIGCNIGGILTVTTNVKGEKVKFPEDSSYLFASLSPHPSMVVFVPINKELIDLKNVDTSNVTNMKGMFGGIRKLTSLDLSSFDTRKVYNMGYMFTFAEDLIEINLSSFDTRKLDRVEYMFASCSSLTELDLRNFDISRSFYTVNMFHSCTSLRSIKTSDKFTANLALKTDGMFAYCKSLVDIDLSKFNASYAWSMIGMFEGCSSLTSLDLSSFTANAAENMSSMFSGCSSLTSLDLSSFQIYKASNLNSMFSNCTSLEELILGDFKTSTVTTMESMFQNCSSLTVLDLRSFDTSKVTNMSFMFNGCSNLTTIYSEAWNTETVANDTEMFLGCEKIVGKSEYAIQTPYNETKVTKEMATPNGGYFTVPDLVEWNATVHYVDDTEPQPIKIQTFIVTDKHPEITTEKLNEFMPDGYELVDDQTSFTVTENDQVFEAKIRKIQWTLELGYQTEDGTVVKEEQLQVTQLNPVVSAQTIIDKTPIGYELVNPASDWTATSNGEKKVIQVREIEWTVNLEYQTVDGDVVKEEQLQVTQLNPVVSSQTIIDKTPIGYELVNPASDWTATANGDKKVIQVREIEWTVNLEYQTVDGNIVKTEAIQVTQLNPVVSAQMITEKVPTGYELVDPATDWTATSNGEKKVIQVREVDWTVSLEYQTEDGTVIKEEQIQVTQLNPVVSSQTIIDKTPIGYELVDPATDWTATANGDKKVIQVRTIEWTVNLEYQTADGNVVKTEAIQITQLNPVVTAQMITEKVPTGYELVDPATDWTATSNGDKKVIQVREVEWIVSLEYQTEDGNVIKEEQIQVTQLNPVVTAQMITDGVPTGYELVDPVSDWTATSNGDKKVIQVREVEWEVNLEYQTEDGNVVKTEAIQVTQLNPVVTAQTITEKVPTGYELVDTASDWTATMNKDKLIVKVREIEWTITIEFITENAKGIVEVVAFNVSSLNPVIEAQQIMDAIPAGYYAVNEIQNLVATKDGELFQIIVAKIEDWEGIVHFVDQNGVTVKTEVYKVTNKDPMIRVEELEKALPISATLVNPLTKLTVTKDKEEFIIEVIILVDEEINQPEIGGDDNTTTDAEQPEGSIEGVQTGDTTQMGLWTMIMSGSIGVLVYLKRKKKNV